PRTRNQEPRTKFQEPVDAWFLEFGSWFLACMMRRMALTLGLIIIAAAVYAIARRVEVRLVLVLSALALALTAGADQAIRSDTWAPLAAEPMKIVRTFVATFSNEKFVVPICSAMGFAFILRETGCDQHLVRLLTKPFERVRPLLVPGAVLVGFLVN